MKEKYKVLIIHNKYLKYGGEEAVVESQIDLMTEKGHKVLTYFRKSSEIKQMLGGKVKSFFLALHNNKSIKDISQIIENESPDIIHIHNLYPLISPGILPFIKKKGIPVIMTVHNFRLLCPTGLFLSNNTICEKCTKGLKELNCVINNCEDSIVKSSGYALRNYWARSRKLYLDNIDAFLCLSSFQKNKLTDNGFPDKKCQVVPNMVFKEYLKSSEYELGSYVGYAGRISKEKGSDIILKIAKELPHIMFKIAGSLDETQESFGIPKNVEFVGFLGRPELSEFYSNSMFILFTSICNETFGLSIIEAFAHKKPVVASSFGASREIIENESTGLIYNNKDHLVDIVKYLFLNPEKVKEMGLNAHERLLELYTPDVYYSRIEKIYEQLIEDNKVAK